MKSLRELYKVGRGPSSSHTMGPEKASKYFLSKTPDADRYEVILYGSLAATGKGHRTDAAIEETIAPKPVKIVFDNDTPEHTLPHANTMDFIAYKEGEELLRTRILSVGGGDIRIEGCPEEEKPEIYKENSFTEIAALCKAKKIRLSDYVFENEGPEIRHFLYDIWQVMKEEIQGGLTTSGILPGGLNVERVAQLLYNRGHIDERPETKENRIVCAYAFAASEQNADCKTIVTAPTCGACAVVPSVLKYMQEKKGFDDEKVIRALAVAGLIGNIVKQNASVSGAECGCQAEVGTACAMAAAGLAELFEMGIDQIEYAAEVSLEHHLGLTCDPICGLVQIPCIERNAVAAMRAINALSLANFLVGTRKISFDIVVKTMYETGRDLGAEYRETSEGGLAKHF
ncbi:MAG: L-serine ammonia-lyase, iron-sulfur-dependent, subunit alpha [Clostridia bacterium]|nr:L-serine ammonia-lyase, iron-sulfur-dependent, subunit alpha [Clostridia bacterium]